MPDQIEVIKNSNNVEVTDESVIFMSVFHEIQPGYVFVKGPNGIKRSGTQLDAIRLGTGKELKGKTVTCSSSVSDVRPDTNNTNVQYYIFQDHAKILEAVLKLS